MLILENWKLTKFSGMPPRKHLPVRLLLDSTYKECSFSHRNTTIYYVPLESSKMYDGTNINRPF